MSSHFSPIRVSEPASCMSVDSGRLGPSYEALRTTSSKALSGHSLLGLKASYGQSCRARCCCAVESSFEIADTTSESSSDSSKWKPSIKPHVNKHVSHTKFTGAVEPPCVSKLCPQELTFQPILAETTLIICSLCWLRAFVMLFKIPARKDRPLIL